MKRTFVVTVILVSVLSLNCRSNHESGGDNKPGTGPGSRGSSTKPTPQPKPGGDTRPETSPGSGGSSTQTPPQPQPKPDGDNKSETGPGSAGSSTQPLPQPKSDGVTKPETAPRPGTELVLRPTLVLIESVPSGASVEIGLKTINSVITPGTGRNVGVTPVTVELRKSDLSPLGNVDGIFRYRGYYEHFFSVPTQGRLESGKKHNVIIKLKKIR